MNVGETVRGVRVYGKPAHELQPGEYMKHEGKEPALAGNWWIHPPDGCLGRLATHTITEHEDGTITVSPSILITSGVEECNWHGFLERGIWRRV